MNYLEKECKKCRRIKALEEFGDDKRRKDGKFPYCRECRSKIGKTPEQRERARQAVKKQRDESPRLRAERVEKERERRYRSLYDISIEEYDQMLEYQGGVCAICGKPPKTRRLAVDHDHKTGEVRGLLCNWCNQTLHDRIDADWLFNAYEYLDVPPVHEAIGRTPIGKKGSVKKRKRRSKKLDESDWKADIDGSK